MRNYLFYVCIYVLYTEKIFFLTPMILSCPHEGLGGWTCGVWIQRLSNEAVDLFVDLLKGFTEVCNGYCYITLIQSFLK